jgi:hypothetical protein
MSNEVGAGNLRSSARSASFLTSPSHCPQYPCFGAASTAPGYAIVACGYAVTAQLVKAGTPDARSVFLGIGLLRAHADRGPPPAHIG